MTARPEMVATLLSPLLFYFGDGEEREASLEGDSLQSGRGQGLVLDYRREGWKCVGGGL